MTEELAAQYAEASRPFVESGGAITEREAGMKSWRYFLEINSACNLACPTCTKGNMAGYDHKTGVMDPDLMERIIEKIKAENPEAIVFLYGNSEPFLHPRLPECIAAVKRRGLNCQLSTNLNHIARVDEVLLAHPDMIIISLSGFTQEVYVRGHAGGHIEKVKENMRLIAEANTRCSPRVHIAVNYHVYKDNSGAGEMEAMESYARGIGLDFFTSFARAISMENAIQYCRHKDSEAESFEVQEGRPDWNIALPPVGQKYIDTMERLRIPPTDARAMYSHYPLQKVCPVGAGSMFTFIRHDGKTSMCACVADRRITVGNYLDTTPDQMIEQRTGHTICKQCIRYRLNLYFHIADRSKWVA